MTPPLLEAFRKFIHFGSLTRPLAIFLNEFVVVEKAVFSFNGLLLVALANPLQPQDRLVHLRQAFQVDFSNMATLILINPAERTRADSRRLKDTSGSRTMTTACASSASRFSGESHTGSMANTGGAISLKADIR